MVHPAVADRRPVPPPEPLPAPVVDAHTHLDACGCVTRDDVAAAMARAAAVGVRQVVTVADDLASARWVVAAAGWHPDLYAAVALHPTRADRLDDEARAELAALAAHPRVVAVGETGLDHYWEAASHPVQAEAFAWHIDLAHSDGRRASHRRRHVVTGRAAGVQVGISIHHRRRERFGRGDRSPVRHRWMHHQRALRPSVSWLLARFRVLPEFRRRSNRC